MPGDEPTSVFVVRSARGEKNEQGQCGSTEARGIGERWSETYLRHRSFRRERLRLASEGE